MALAKTMSLNELRRRNEASQAAAREAAKRATPTPTTTPKKG
ncbi:hypothetical protein AB0E11_27675 [Streptomyces fradiae]|nr:hypothetical protein [Streptomyces fradiae]WOI58620.1 hypothetical protein RYQ63_00970 [Streptomyces fradiae]